MLKNGMNFTEMLTNSLEALKYYNWIIYLQQRSTYGL